MVLVSFLSVPERTVLFVFLYRLFRIQWQPGLSPRIESAIERMHVFPTTFRKFLRHPGARCFVRSSAIGDNRAILWYFIDVCRELFSGDSDSVR